MFDKLMLHDNLPFHYTGMKLKISIWTFANLIFEHSVLAFTDFFVFVPKFYVFLRDLKNAVFSDAIKLLQMGVSTILQSLQNWTN